MNALVKQTKRRAFMILLFFIFSIGFLIYRIGYIKYAYGEEYEEKAVMQMLNTEKIILPSRGNIVDRNYHDLVLSSVVYNVILDPNVLLEQISEEEKEKTITTLSQILSISQETLNERISNNPNSRYEVIVKHIESDIAQKIKENDLKGVWLEEDTTRNYLKNDFAAALIGFVNQDKQAQYGVEQQYNKYLSGVVGRIFPMLKEGKYVIEETIPAQKGDTIVLTIDETIQHFAEMALKKAVEEHNPKNASVIIMDPNTGEVLAMATYPTFNPNKYNDLSEFIGEDTWNQLSNEEKLEKLNEVWRNYNISDTYEPGSTFKPILVAAALEENIISVEDTYNCEGHKTIYGQTIKCWKTSGHGEQTLEEALANSCNVAMMDIAEKMGSDVFYHYQKLFGFGEVTGIDLPGEAKGILYDADDLKPVELATSSFGQSFTVTPIQILNGFAAVINGGNLMQPYVVKQIVSENGTEIKEMKPVLKRKVISKETSQILRNYLESVVNNGTGKKAKVDGYRIGGKTGTAEKLPRGEDKYVLSFIGFAPVEDPQVILLVILDETEYYSEGSGAAAPVAKEIFQNILPYMGIEASAEEDEEENTDVEIPDYVGLELLEVDMDLTIKGLNYEIIGEGNTIKEQFPNPGTKVPKGTTIKLYVTQE
ncbi:penicillin-binding transpeptidase domain-containing protein [Defluviitalea phaphyphila]|uniref:penicillin-binding transpeptidase domain-containing protein n=1 Tax=Defluviitalea phaphyphila TaxID=1473580 RepID=UPI00072FEDDB|nr:penicillin-binding transpeptidase domain-containing protein [Defluviitalea phaphyphila]